MKLPVNCGSATPWRDYSLRVSVTDRCPFRCAYCMPPGGVPLRAHADVLRYEEIAALVQLLGRVVPLGKVRLTGGEPLIRPEIEKLVGLLARLGIPELALTTNGQLLAGLAGPLRAAGLTRINISLDSLNAQTYRQLTGNGVLARTIEGIDEALRCGLAPVKLNMVVLRGVNDAEILDMVAFALARGVEVRFLEVMPIGTAAPHHQKWFVPAAEVIATVEGRYPLTPITRSRGSTSRCFQVRDGACRPGRIGFISACSEPFCADCNRLRLTSDGRLLGCLAADHGVPVRALLAAGAEGERQLKQAVRDILACKKIRDTFQQPQIMATIGG
ncbi:MAG: GTP 3',8-cyclase MoaA [bacterium]